jgi:hypothetical protein
MADSRKRSKRDGSRSTKSERSQLTLEDWADELRPIRGATVTPPRGPASSDISAVSASQVDNERRAGMRGAATSHRPAATKLLETPGALLTRSHLRELGLERRAIDAVFRTLGVVFLPGYSRPMVRVEDYLALVQEFTYHDDRVRPIAKAS